MYTNVNSYHSERGLSFSRAVMCLAACDGERYTALTLAQRVFGRKSEPVLFFEKSLDITRQKAAVPAAYTGDSSGWAEDIAEPAGREFVDLVDSVSIFGRLGMVRAPMSTRLVGIGTGATAYWRGQGKPAPVTQLAMNGGSFSPLTVTALAVLSDEVFKVGDPNAEQYIRAELMRAKRQAMDIALVDPANSGVANEKPASLLNGVTPVSATGDVEYDLKAVIDDFPGDLERAFFVARPETFASLHSPYRPLVGARGGELLGIPCIASKHVLQPMSGETLALIDPTGIVAGDDGIEIDIADQASLELLDSSLEQDATDGTGATTAGMVSLFQIGAKAIKIERRVNWNAVRPSVSFIEDLAIEAVSA